MMHKGYFITEEDGNFIVTDHSEEDIFVLTIEDSLQEAINWIDTHIKEVRNN